MTAFSFILRISFSLPKVPENKIKMIILKYKKMCQKLFIRLSIYKKSEFMLCQVCPQDNMQLLKCCFLNGILIAHS